MKILGFNITREGAKPKEPTEVTLVASTQVTAAKKEEQVELPSAGGRSSIPSEAVGFGAYISEMANVEPDFITEVYAALESLATWNDDVSYAIDNIITLGNTPYKIFFDDGINEDLAEEMILRVKRQAKKWYGYSDGMNGLINDLLAQIAVNGALSAEAVPADDLSSVKHVVLVPPREIKFKYDAKSDLYAPYQVIGNMFGLRIDSEYGMKRLNTVTYKYASLRRFNAKPYGVPPMLSAFESLSIERDLVCNFKTVIKRLGVLGFLEVLLTAPQRRPEEVQTLEGDNMYKARCQAYLNSALEEAEKGFNKGLAVGFKNSHEFKMQPTTTNVQGATDMFEWNDRRKMSGLKQDPLMLGRNFSTTETVGRVLLAKLSTQVGNYQSIVANFLSNVILMDLRLAGYPVQVVEFEFDKPLVGDKLRDAQAYEKEITNNDMLYKQGVIDQQVRAQNLGYEQADQDEPREPVIPLKDLVPVDDTSETKGTAANSKKKALTVTELEAEIRGEGAEYDYGMECSCEACSQQRASLSFDTGDAEYNENADGYTRDMKKAYDKVVKLAAKRAAAALEELGLAATFEQVRDRVMYEVFTTFNGNFGKPQAAIIEKWLSRAYKYYRSDITVFGNALSSEIPKALFGLHDVRVLEYYKKSDSLYLGRFITDEDTKKKITEYLKKRYIEDGLPIGNNKAALDEFRATFTDVLKGEDWKLRRVIDTSVNKMRNYGNVAYLNQGGIERFVIRGINDQLQCKWCASMQGKSFEVKKAFDKTEEVAATEPAYIGVVAPFINTLYKGQEGLDKLATLTAEEIQASGIDVPPFHPACRDRIVADL